MKTFEYTFTLPTSDIQHDMLTTMLGELGFDSFMDEDLVLKAYCTEDHRDDVAVEELLRLDAFTDIHLLAVEEMPDKDWNEVWEASYPPVVVNERCRVRAPFHEPDPSFEFDLVIEPKMSFGTANHETTAQLITLMLDTDFQGKEVLDMGSGTAVLAILAKKLGAGRTVAIDNDEWAYRNAFTNVALNGIDDIEIVLGTPMPSAMPNTTWCWPTSTATSCCATCTIMWRPCGRRRISSSAAFTMKTWMPSRPRRCGWDCATPAIFQGTVGSLLSL